MRACEVSGCQLNASVRDFLLPLANTPLSTIAASSAGLTGDVADLAGITAIVDGFSYSSWTSKLSMTLQAIDISSNSIGALTGVPARLRVDLGNNRIALVVTRSVVAAATSRQVELWLEGTRIKNPEELGQLLPRELRPQDKFTTRTGSTFACRELVLPWLRITPELFMPEEMCACRAGYTGHATTCTPCPADTYSGESWPCNDNAFVRSMCWFLKAS